jgi:uncharacterized damage-inducible protein DinB
MQTGELANYRDYLDHYRSTIERQCADLTPEQLATASVPPSELTLLGLVRHLRRVEHYWFRMVLDEHLEEPRFDEDDPTGGFRSIAPTPEAVEEAFTGWREQIAYADAWLDAHQGDDLGAQRRTRKGEEATIRDVMVHLIEEYARHAGHADLLRELIDGRTDL